MACKLPASIPLLSTAATAHDVHGRRVLRLLLLFFFSCLLPLAAAEEPVCETEECHDSDEEGQDYTDIDLKWWTLNHTLDDFPVAGVNLASYVPGSAYSQKTGDQEEPFELFEEYDIAHLVKGNETWYELLHYRRDLQNPKMSFYVDKVALKRWLPQHGFDQPETYVTKYKDELLPSTSEDDEASFSDYVEAIQELLPTDKSYVAKPTHLCAGMGTWLVDYDENGKTNYTRAPRAFWPIYPDEPASLTYYDDEDDMDRRQVATSLAHSLLHEKIPSYESWSLRNVKPGMVVEERYMGREDSSGPPDEFQFFTIWGRVWVAFWNFSDGGDSYNWGCIYRNGTGTLGSPWGEINGYDTRVPEWTQWDKMVEIAERLGANKDLFRIDMFVGIPKTSDGTSEIKVAVSEIADYPTTTFGVHADDQGLQNEAGRLWAAGYKMLNYKVVGNNQVPSDYVVQQQSTS